MPTHIDFPLTPKELLEILNSNKEGIKFSMYQYDWDMNNKELLEIKPFNPESCK